MISDLALNFKYVRRFLLGSNFLTFPLLKLAPTRQGFAANAEKMISLHSDICIEGFPHSGNTFFTRLVQQWNPEYRIARHLHVPHQVISAAVVRKKPTLVLIREPSQAISSLLFKHQSLHPLVAVLYYYLYYKMLLPYKDRYVVVDFDEMITNPIPFLEMANQRFNSHVRFDAFDKAMEEKIIGQIPAKVNKQHPSAEKAKRRLIAEGLSRMRLFRSATHVYHRFAKSGNAFR